MAKKRESLLPRTLGEAYARQPALILTANPNKSESNTRNIPYSEYYRMRTGVIETPIQRLAQLGAHPSSQ